MDVKYDKTSIILMSKLAVYDGGESLRDERVLANFRHDYIYAKNARLRLGVFFGFIVLLALYVMKLFAVDGMNADDFLVGGLYKQLLIQAGVYLLILEVSYTALGSVIYTVEYQKARRNCENYFETLDKLEKRRVKLAAKARKIKDLKEIGELEEYTAVELENLWEDLPDSKESILEKKKPPKEDPDEEPDDDLDRSGRTPHLRERNRTDAAKRHLETKSESRLVYRRREK